MTDFQNSSGRGFRERNHIQMNIIAIKDLIKVCILNIFLPFLLLQYIIEFKIT